MNTHTKKRSVLVANCSRQPESNNVYIASFGAPWCADFKQHVKQFVGGNFELTIIYYIFLLLYIQIFICFSGMTSGNHSETRNCFLQQDHNVLIVK